MKKLIALLFLIPVICFGQTTGNIVQFPAGKTIAVISNTTHEIAITATNEEIDEYYKTSHDISAILVKEIKRLRDKYEPISRAEAESAIKNNNKSNQKIACELDGIK